MEALSRNRTKPGASLREQTSPRSNADERCSYRYATGEPDALRLK